MKKKEREKISNINDSNTLHDFNAFMDDTSMCVLYLCNVLHEFQGGVMSRACYVIKRSCIVIIF